MLMLGLYTAPPSAGGALLLDATPFVRSCQFGADAHGFERLTAVLTRPMASAFRLYDQAVIYVGVFWNGKIVWEGRLEDPTLAVGGQGSGLTAQALGAWRSLTDVPAYTAFWSKSTVTDFRPVLTTEIATAQPDRFTFTAQNYIQIMPQKGATFGTTGAAKQAYYAYLAPNGSAKTIVGAQFAFTFTVPAINWRAILLSQSAAFATLAAPWAFTSGGAGTTTRAVHVTFATAPIISFFMDLNAADVVLAGETGSAFLRISSLRLVGSSANEISTTLTANRAAGANVTATVGSTAGMYVGQELCINSAANPSEIVAVLSIGSTTQFNATFVNNYVIGNAVQGFRVLADEIVRDVVARNAAVNASQLSTSTALIQSPGLDLSDEIYLDATPADIFTHLAGLGDTSNRQWETGIYEGRQVFFRPQGQQRAWYVDATDLGIARTIEDLANVVYATYTDASGRVLHTANASDAASIARYGLIRVASVAADTANSVQAGIEASTLLADRKNPLPRATIRFTAVYDAAGGRYPLWLVRAGDTITIRNLPPNVSTSIDRIRTFRITHTSYDAFADTLDVEPESAPRTLEVMLARRAEGIR